MQELIRRCQQGDKDAFDELFMQFGNEALRTAYFITHNVQEAEDVLQDTFLDVHRDIRKLLEPNRFRVWLRVITVHHALRRVRARKNDVLFNDEALLSGDHYSFGVAPDEHVSRAELKDVIRLAFQQLNPMQRSVLVMKYFQDLMDRDIAEALGCSIGTVKSRLHYAKKSLVTILNKVDIRFTRISNTPLKVTSSTDKALESKGVSG